MKSTWTLRPAQIEDAGAITDAVVTATKAQSRWQVPAAEEAGWVEGYADWTRQCCDGTDALRVVEANARVLGRLRIEREVLTAGEHTIPRLKICVLQLHPDVQGRGIGSAIIGQLMDEARAAGGFLDLGVAHDNPNARRLYDRLGFTPVGRDENQTQMRWTP